MFELNSSFGVGSWMVFIEEVEVLDARIMFEAF